MPEAELPAVAMLPIEVTVVGKASVATTRIPDALPPAVVIFPVEVTVTAPVPLPWAKIP
jgi:hypothetical protein